MPQYLRENTEDRRLRYEAFLRRIMADADKLDARSLVRIQELIIDLKSRVVERLSARLAIDPPGDTWGAFWIPRLNAAIDDVVRDLSAKAARTMATEFGTAFWNLGSRLVDGTISAVRGLSLEVPVIDPILLGILAPFESRLIVGIDESTRQAIDKALKVNIALGEPAELAIQKIAGEVDVQGTPFRTVGDRAEAIVRTELARVQELANRKRLEQTRQEFPELFEGPSGLKQVFVSVQIGKWPCKVCQPYDGTVWDIDDPDKPEPPLHPRCRCMLSPFWPGVSRVRTVPEPDSKRQRKASLVECGCCG